MNIYESLVSSFLDTFGQRVYPTLRYVPCSVLSLRATLIGEEHHEYMKAASNLEELDALCDLMYVLVGTGLVCGIPIKEGIVSAYPKPLRFAESVINELSLSVPSPALLDIYMSRLFSDILTVALYYKFENAFKAVHENNMQKLWTEKPTTPDLICIPRGDKYLVLRAKDRKVVKPPNHKLVDLTPFL